MKRALAHRFPYAPQYKELLGHPSMQKRMYVYQRVMVLDHDDEELLRYAMDSLAKDAARELDGKKILHFEVIPPGDEGKIGYYALIGAEDVE